MCGLYTGARSCVVVVLKIKQKGAILFQVGKEGWHMILADVGSVGAVRELVRIDRDTDLGELGYDLGEGDVWW